MSEESPNCEHWLVGDIVVEERDGFTHRYERAILVSFKTLEEFRKALKIIDQMWSKPAP